MQTLTTKNREGKGGIICKQKEFKGMYNSTSMIPNNKETMFIDRNSVENTKSLEF